MKFRSSAIAGAALLAGAVWSQASYATTFTIDVWTNVETASKHATAANVPGTPATFVYDLNFTGAIGAFDLYLPHSGTDTVAAFLATEPAGDGTIACVSCTGANDPI